MMNINIYKCLQVWSDIYMHQLLEWYVVTWVSNLVCFFINQNWTHHSCSFCNKIVAQQTWRRVLKRVFPQNLFFNLTSPLSCTHSLLQFASYMLERWCYVQGSSKRLFIIIFLYNIYKFQLLPFFYEFMNWLFYLSWDQIMSTPYFFLCVTGMSYLAWWCIKIYYILRFCKTWIHSYFLLNLLNCPYWYLFDWGTFSNNFWGQRGTLMPKNLCNC